MRHLIKFSRNINSIFLKTNVLVIVNFDCTTDLRKWWQMSSLETFPDTGDGTCHRAKLFLVNHWRNTQVCDRNRALCNECSLSWEATKPPAGPRMLWCNYMYRQWAILILDWLLFYEHWENKPVEKNLRSVRFVCLALIVHVHRIDTKKLCSGDNVTDKLYYPEITVYNPKKNGGGCHTLI